MVAPPNRSQFQRYGLSVLVCALSVALAQARLFEGLQFCVFLFAVTMTAWYAGFGPGLLAAGLSFLALEFFFLPPVYSLAISNVQDVLRLFIFMLAAFVVNLSFLKEWHWWSPLIPVLPSSEKPRSGGKLAAAAFELLATSSDQVVFLLDRQGNVVSWSPGAERLTGFAKQQILDQPFSCLYPASAIPEGKPQFSLQNAAVRQARHEEETWLMRRDGIQFRAKLSITALRESISHSKNQAQTCRDGLCGFLVKLSG